MTDPAERARRRDQEHREEFAIRKQEREMETVEHALERELRAFEADEARIEREIEAEWRRERFGHDPERPPAWRSRPKPAGSRPKPAGSRR